ncbi:MAG: M23 family metallopeptidase [Clostridia bacterium]|nr:M23 family metallopeptidase [Clostridia bacterium]
MNDELEYAQMLEVPVSTVSVVKKKNLFKRKNARDDEELKEQVVDSVNERLGDYVFAEDLSVPPKEEGKKAFAATISDRAGKILVAEIVAACLLAVGIFLTNVFMANSVINTFIKSLSAETTAEASYSEFQLVSVVSDLADAEVSVSAEGVITFTADCCVYPVCDGTVASVTQNTAGLYTVKVEHTSAFTSVITGLSAVYYSQGESVKGNIPVGYTDGSGEVSVSMYNGGELLNCYTLSGALPVWNS